MTEERFELTEADLIDLRDWPRGNGHDPAENGHGNGHANGNGQHGGDDDVDEAVVGGKPSGLQFSERDAELLAELIDMPAETMELPAADGDRVAPAVREHTSAPRAPAAGPITQPRHSHPSGLHPRRPASGPNRPPATPANRGSSNGARGRTGGQKTIVERHPASSAAELVAHRVSAWFGTNNVLKDVSLHMKARSVTALIGPSGCGKSTFLRILNRMHELVPGAALAGRVLLDGADIYDAGQRPTDNRRKIGMVFQKPNPFPAMSIYDNVLAGPKLTRTPIVDRDALVEDSLRRAGLWNEVRNRLTDPGGALSGGQQQRLCIARALAIKPQVLLMDEPCSALDPTSTRRIEETIAEIGHDVTIVIVTHNMQQAQRVSHRCAFFLAGENEPGRIVEEGTTEKIFNDPTDPQTADYVNGRFG